MHFRLVLMRVAFLCVLTKVDEHFAIALPHILRHGEDAGHIVVQE